MDAGALGNRPINNNYEAVTKIAGLATVRHFYPAMLCIRVLARGMYPSVCHKSVFCRNG